MRGRVQVALHVQVDHMVGRCRCLSLSVFSLSVPLGGYQVLSVGLVTGEHALEMQR